MQKQKSTNLHDFDHELFLGFIAEQPLKKTEIDISYIGGQPLWLYQPNMKLLLCNECSSEGETLTFLGQIFCPLNAKHCYNRVMYLFYCEKCRRTFKTIKQQTDQNWQPSKQQKKPQTKKYKSISQQSFQIESDPLQRKQLIKIMNRSKIQVEQEIILQQQGENDDEQQGEQIVTVQKMTGEEMMNKLAQIEKAKKNRQYTEKEIQEINTRFQALKMQEKEDNKEEMATKQMTGNKKDHVFEQYIRTIKQLNNPVMIYSNIAVPYNKSPLNPKHTCKYCSSKLELEIQLTQKILLFSKNLAMLDWGSIFIYACTGSCKQSEQECVVSQYEFDAVSEQEIAKLKKTKKNRKKNKNKSVSKEKKRMQKQGEMKEIQPKIVSSKIEQAQQKQDGSDQQGDWD